MTAYKEIATKYVSLDSVIQKEKIHRFQNYRPWKAHQRRRPMTYPLFRVEWAMPSPATFTIPPIRRFIETWNTGGEIYDPFCGGSTIANHRNDIAITGIDSLDWLQEQPDKCADIFLNDPAYTPRQRKEVYKSLGIDLHDTKAS